MKAILIPTWGNVHFIEVEGETVGEQLKSLQEIVGGKITTVTIAEDACLIADDEGLIKGKPINPKASRFGVPMVGEVVVVGVEYDHFIDVPDGIKELMEERRVI